MSRPPVVLDTNVFIRNRSTQVLGTGLLSAVVLQELTAGARDVGELRRLARVRAEAEKQGVLLTPDGEDWYHAGKVLNSLYRGLRSRRSAQPVAIPREEQQRLLRDVLIARSAKRANAAVATYNAADFEKIRRFCNVRVMDPADVL